MRSATLIQAFQVHNSLGEGVTWRESDQSCWWVDIERKILFRLDWPCAKITKYSLPLKVSAFGFIKGDDNQLVVATEDGFGLYQPGDDYIKLFERPQGLKQNMRLNDGRVDACGRFWAGSMYDGKPPVNAKPSGHLYRLEPNGSATPIISSLGIPNGLSWSPDRKFMYLSDSERHIVSRARFDENIGLPGVFSTYAEFDAVFPDGATVDSKGGYWCTLWGGAKIVRLDESGQVTMEVIVPAKQVSCCTFGGENLNLLFVTSARHDLSMDDLGEYPDSGGLFIYETAYQGLSTPRVSLAL